MKQRSWKWLRLAVATAQRGWSATLVLAAALLAAIGTTLTSSTPSPAGTAGRPSAGASADVVCWVTESSTDPLKLRLNASGQTYGSSSNADPDLVAVVFASCAHGYVYREDLEGFQPRSPKEALAYQDTPEGRKGRDIPVYESDGTTLIGQFHVDGSE